MPTKLPHGAEYCPGVYNDEYSHQPVTLPEDLNTDPASKNPRPITLHVLAADGSSEFHCTQLNYDSGKCEALVPGLRAKVVDLIKGPAKHRPRDMDDFDYEHPLLARAIGEEGMKIIRDEEELSEEEAEAPYNDHEEAVAELARRARAMSLLDAGIKDLLAPCPFRSPKED